MTNVPSFTDHISREKQELLAMLLQEAGEELTPFPLSFAQQRLWFLNQLEPDSPLYNMPIAVRLQGALNFQALSDSLQAIVDRHESLRTTFTVVEEQPIQLIAARGSITIREVDLSHLVAEEREAETGRIVTEEARQPFDLAQGPLLRALLLRQSDREHVLLLTLHHIIADGWSLGVLVQELASFYQANLTGGQAGLPELEIQYADFAQWQRDEMQGEFLDEQLSYWKRQLAGQLPVLDLPTDHPRPASPTFRGAHHPFTIAGPIADSLKALCRQEGVTPFMTLLAAFKTTLYRYTHQTDLLVGTPIANRSQEVIEPLIGFFANTLVLRTDLGNNPSFRELLGRVRDVTLSAYEYQDIPFEKLVEELQPQRSLSHNPLFQVMFVLQNAPMPELRLPDLTLSTLDIESGTAKFDLLLAIHEAEDGLRGEIEYSTELFEPVTIARLAGHFQTLLREVVANPDQRIADLPLLTTAEQQILRSWNATTTHAARPMYLHTLFSEQAARTPDAVAVAFAAADQGANSVQTMTYRELDKRSNQIAHYLRGLGVGPDMPVGICMERSLDRMVALLGALKAGGAYLPLDPANPRERLALVLRDSGAPVVLTHQALRDQLPAESIHTLCLDQAWPVITQEPDLAPKIALAPTNLAYIIYTSGSTGQPKGVSIDHRPLTNLVAWQLESGLHPGALRTLQFAAPTFDVSLQEIFTSWATGSTLFLTDENIQRDAERLLDILAEHRIERLFMPFVALQQLAEVAHERAVLPSELREIITAGEQLQITPRIVELFQRLPGCQLHNHYGPTESHVVTTFVLEEAPEHWPVLPPIGRPIANTQIYLLDSQLRQVPIGVPGELYIGGDGLARGYLHQPALTAEKFVPDPFSAVPGARLYRTGDLARYRASGAIEFLGRRDHQVKVRGFRVELGEIEAALRQHPAIRETAVVVREDESGMRRLVAYLVKNPDPQRVPATQNGNLEPDGSGFSVLTTSGVRAFLQERLPEYMLPSAFVWLDALPLTRHGKVDRRALPAPTDLPASEGGHYVAPRTHTEEILAGIWREILRGPQVGIHDNFFALGGHSLLATQVITRIRRNFSVDLPLRALFEAPTVAELAQRIATTQQIQSLPPIQPADRTQDLPLSFAQERLWFLDQMNPDSTTYNLPSYIRLHGNLDQRALERSLNAIVARHEALRTAFPSTGGRPVQVVEPAQELTLSIVDLRHLPAELRPVEARQVIQADAAQPFNIRLSPLLRATLIRLDEREHLLLLTMHHIVSDAWSLDVLLNELSALYTAFSTGEEESIAGLLPPLPIQYADYAAWQRAWLQGPIVEHQIEYWREQLRGLPVLNLPTDHPRPPVQTFKGATYSFDLPFSVSEQIRALSRQDGATVFMTLLAVWQTLLYRYADQDDFAVGTPVGNRSRAEIEGLIGFFVNMLVLRADLSGNPSFRELLGRVRETALRAYANQDLPFEKLVDELQPERDMSRSPLFQVMFALNQAPALHRQLPELEMSPVAVEGTAAKFDLTLWMTASGDDLSGMLEYNIDLFDAPTIERMAGHFMTLLEGILVDPDRRIADLPLLTEGEREQMQAWNATETDYQQLACIHELIAAQAARTPAATAAIFQEQRLSYQELNDRADRLANYLRGLGVRPGVFVGIHLERSIEMIVAILGVLKAGGAYVPLDPAYPRERLQFMVADAQIAVLLTQQRIAGQLHPEGAQQSTTVVNIDSDWQQIAAAAEQSPEAWATPLDLAYVIYTSGSTGKPKGVMVPHGAVINFFRGMDDRIGTERGTWLAVTSISFDISVLELLWTLARGFEVVIQADPDRTYGTAATRNKAHDRPIDFSLFYFSSDDSADNDDAYQLLLEGAKFADRHGFTAVWTPERHFHKFGGLYPNPSVVSAAIAAVTERVHIRAGSVVLPLQNPIRVAEEWAVVDRLSRGRAGISFASGWHADDFVLAPENYRDRKAIMLRDIETVRKLWRGESIIGTGGAGQPVEVRTRPRPIQPELPFWITAGGSPDTFRMAGEAGANLLTHLLGQSIEELAEKITAYRKAWRDAGHSGEGHVTLMLHTFVGEDMAAVRETVREPFTNYLRTSLDLIGNLARSMGRDPNAEDFTEADMEALLAHAFDRYVATSSLLGTPESCLRMVKRLKEIDVDEVGCLIDFGVDVPLVLDSLTHLNTVRELSNRPASEESGDGADYSIPAQMLRHGVTHFQCTPALARMLSAEPGMQAAFGGLRTIMLGGEAFPPSLAEQLTTLVPGTILNMYGPTETTIWSTVHPVTTATGSIPIGRPIANTTIAILDRQLRPVPVGVPGELYIGGAGVVRGYLHRPELTAERFIPDPWTTIPGQRLYKTGDQARYLLDGSIDYLGRLDHQVKLGGYRIELGEIEARLSEHSGVREAAVVVREDQPDEKYLAAYVVPAQRGPRALPLAVSAEEQRRIFEHRPRYTLPNGMVIARSSDLQAHLSYQEIMIDEMYLKHDIHINDGDVIFDVGANMGFFSMFVNQQRPNTTIHAFEPIPPTFDVLRTNVTLYGLNVRLYNCGLSDKNEQVEFTFYPEMAGLSGRYSEAGYDLKATKAVILSGLQEGSRDEVASKLSEQDLDAILERQFTSEKHLCQLRTLSEIIREQEIDRIDLLKIDVERAEVDVLRGIREEDWAKIKQVVLEVDTQENRDEVGRILVEHGFRVIVDDFVVVEAERDDEGVYVYMLYATRATTDAPPAVIWHGKSVQQRPEDATDTLSTAELRAYLKERLPEYMVPSSVMILPELPRTPNGKLDRKALPAPTVHRPELEVAYVAPSSELEETIAGVWRAVLHVEQVGVHDSFFELGGTSLLIVQARTKLREALGYDVSLVDLFRYPTISTLAEYLGQNEPTKPTLDKARARAEKQLARRQRRTGKAGE